MFLSWVCTQHSVIQTINVLLHLLQETGMTALLYASLKGHLPVVRELVDVYSVDVFQKSKVRMC